MIARLQKFSFSSDILERGFWLYVWKIVTKDGGTFFYVGRTGDSSSLNAQSPFSRVSGHLSSNKHSNALRRHLEGPKGPGLGACKSFEFVAFGPIFGETRFKASHRKRRDKIAALEKALCDEFKREFGDRVLNTVNCNFEVEKEIWAEVKRAFGPFIEESARS